MTSSPQMTMASKTQQPDDRESSAPTYKRRRVGLACRSCRNRKSRCDGAQPACGLCIELGFECVYQRPAIAASAEKKASTEPSDRLAAIERVLEMLVQRDKARSDKEHSSRQIEDGHDGSMPTRFPQGSGLQQPTPQSHDGLREDGADTDPHETSGEESIDGLATVSNVEHRGSRFFGPSSNIALLKLAGVATTTAWGSANTITRHDPNHRKHSLKSPSVSSDQNLRQPLSCFDLPSEARGRELLKAFFADTGTLFPYIHETRAVQSFAAMIRTGPKSCRPSLLCLIHMIFAFASRTSPESRTVQEAELFASRARSLLPKLELRTATIETVQALLLVTQYLQGTQQANETWNVFGIVHRTALHLGLQSSSALKSLSPLDAEIRKRTWFGCVLMDMSLSMTFGRPPAIPKEYIRLEHPLNCKLDDLAASDGPQHHISSISNSCETVEFFIATIKLYAIQRDVLTDVYDSNLEGDFVLEANDLLLKTFLLDQRLHEWWSLLVPQLKLKPWVSLSHSPSVQAAFPPMFDKLSVIMRLRYLNTQILLYRPTLALVLRSQDGLLSDQTRDKCVMSSEAAATEIVGIVHQCYSNPSLLGAGWFSAYYTFNASIILYICVLLLIRKDTRRSSLDLPASGTMTTMTEVRARLEKLNNAAEAIEGVSSGAAWGTKLRDTIQRLAEIISSYLEAASTQQVQSFFTQQAAPFDVRMPRNDPTNFPSAAPFTVNSFTDGNAEDASVTFQGASGPNVEMSWTDHFNFDDNDMFLTDLIAI